MKIAALGLAACLAAGIHNACLADDLPAAEQFSELLEQAVAPGARVRRPGVALTLQAIAGGGREAFYGGAFGEGLMADFPAAGLVGPLSRKRQSGKGARSARGSAYPPPLRSGGAGPARRSSWRRGRCPGGGRP